jgi:hypothetical protein
MREGDDPITPLPEGSGEERQMMLKRSKLSYYEQQQQTQQKQQREQQSYQRFRNLDINYSEVLQ